MRSFVMRPINPNAGRLCELNFTALSCTIIASSRRHTLSHLYGAIARTSLDIHRAEAFRVALNYQYCNEMQHYLICPFEYNEKLQYLG